MKHLLIMRGLPGSGKTRYVRNYIAEWLSGGGPNNYKVCSADHFFERGGGYHFNPSRIGEAHASCQTQALEAMHSSLPLVIIDNTHTQHWEYAIYATMGKCFGYNIDIVTVGNRDKYDVSLYAKRNVHNVPFNTIQRMAERFEE